VTSNGISRPFWRRHHRVVQKFGIAYLNEIDESIGHFEDVATSIDAILPDPAPVVYVEEPGDEVAVHIHCWIKDLSR